MRKIIVLIFYFVITICLCSCKFNGYYKVEIPTNSPLKGTIKIPNECEFVTEDGIVKLINKNTKEILAEQISQGYFEVLYEKDGKKIYNEKKIIFNESISGDIKNFENYEYVIGYSNATGIFKFSDGDFVYEILSINIYDDKKMGSYYLKLIIYDNLDRETLQKIRSSYSWGGLLGFN